MAVGPPCEDLPQLGGTGRTGPGAVVSRYDPLSGTSPANPRQQVNAISAWIDGSGVYATDATRAAALRASGGRLATSSGNLLPYNTSGLDNVGGAGADLFLAGDTRANEQVGLTAMHTLFVREHNRWADHFAQTFPGLDDEAIYQRARKMVGAEVQRVTYAEFLPSLLGAGAVGTYGGYDEAVDGGIANAFATAGYRFGHTTLPAKILRLDNEGNPLPADNLDLKDAFFQPDELVAVGIEPYLKGLAEQGMQEVDTHLVDAVRNFLFGAPGAGGFDLASLNIQRGRDHGLPDYNRMRMDYGLTPVTEFAQITSNPDKQAVLEALYASVNDIDPWVGGLIEDHLPAGSLGELLTTMVLEQFERLRSGDRFWYENDPFFAENPHLLARIEALTLADIIEFNTGLSGLQANVFLLSPAAVPLPASLWLLASALPALRRRPAQAVRRLTRSQASKARRRLCPRSTTGAG